MKYHLTLIFLLSTLNAFAVEVPNPQLPPTHIDPHLQKGNYWTGTKNPYKEAQDRQPTAEKRPIDKAGNKARNEAIKKKERTEKTNKSLEDVNTDNKTQPLIAPGENVSPGNVTGPGSNNILVDP